MSSGAANGFIEPQYEIETVDDIRKAVRRARAEGRVIFEEHGEPPVAVVPLIDLKLLLRLEDKELDRIDLEEIRHEEQAADNQKLVAWEDAKVSMRT